MAGSMTYEPAPLLGIGDVPVDRPIVTLDIDGVLNAYDSDRGPSPWVPPCEPLPVPYGLDRREDVRIPDEMCEEYGRRPGATLTITWSTALMGDLADLADGLGVTVLWLTSWNRFAGFLASTRFWPGGGSPAIGHIDVNRGGTCGSAAGKAIAIEELCARLTDAHPGGDVPPLVSFDDDAPWDALLWGRPANPLPGFFHGIRTEPAWGITMSQMAGLIDIVG